jgi:hypothetical protein
MKHWYSREGKDERQINPVKKVLISMRRTFTYRETKLRLIHKLKGLDLIADSFDKVFDKSASERHWFKGYHVFSSRQEVIDRLQMGKPLSCFTLQGSSAEVHVAFSEGEQEGSTISYLTLEYDTTRSIIETGVHYCHFELKGSAPASPTVILNINKNELRPKIVNYALVLPYVVQPNASSSDADVFQKFTLIYPDWEVLLCDDGDENDGVSKKKGRVMIDKQLYL